MAIAKTGVYRDRVGEKEYPLVLRNGELERFEEQYAPFGIFELWDQLTGRASPPQVRHVRDLVALGLVGGGMSDRAADTLLADLPPSENMALRGVALRLLGVTFLPAAMEPGQTPKKAAGSRGGAKRDPKPATTRKRASKTSAA